MAMGTERSKGLHNFTLPSELRWGNQRFLRCMRVNSNDQISPLRGSTDNSCSSDRHRSNQQSYGERGTEKDSSPEFVHGSHKVGATPLPPSLDGSQRFGDDDDGIDAIREKVLLDLQTAADKMKDAIFKNDPDKGEVSGSLPPPPPTPVSASEEGQISKPWNLRTRRAACKIPVSRFVSSLNGRTATAVGEDSAGWKGLTADVVKPNLGSSQMRTGLAAVADKSPTLMSGGSGAGEKRERPKFSVALSKGEIEEDFFAMVGHRPARRPKKRAKNVKRQLDTLFPGVWLTEVTPDMYKVSEAAP